MNNNLPMEIVALMGAAFISFLLGWGAVWIFSRDSKKIGWLEQAMVLIGWTLLAVMVYGIITTVLVDTPFKMNCAFVIVGFVGGVLVGWVRLAHEFKKKRTRQEARQEKRQAARIEQKKLH